MTEDISKRTVVYSVPGMNEVQVRHEGPLDIYEAGSRSTVIFVAGYPDEGFERMLGHPFKEMGFVTSWARLLAASGITAVTYTNRTIDLPTVIKQFDRVSLWASSGSGPLALSMLMRDSSARVESAVLCYPYTFHVPPEGKRFGFAAPCDDRSPSDLASDIPIFIARAGRDETPGLNRTLDAFIAGALEANLPLTVMNHPTGSHAFDLSDDSATTKHVVESILEFLRRRRT